MRRVKLQRLMSWKILKKESNMSDKDVSPLEAPAREAGFDNAFDLTTLINMVDITNESKAAAFAKWKEEDGSKIGLLHVIGVHVFGPNLVGDYIFEDTEVRDKYFRMLREREIGRYLSAKNKLDEVYFQELRNLEQASQQNYVDLEDQRKAVLIGIDESLK